MQAIINILACSNKMCASIYLCSTFLAGDDTRMLYNERTRDRRKMPGCRVSRSPTRKTANIIFFFSEI